MIKISGQAQRLRVYVGESDRYQGQPVYHAIVAKAKALDLAGASVFRGLEGFGANSRIHTSRLLELSSDLPIVVELVDSEEYIAKLLPFLDEAVGQGMVTLEKIEVVHYRHNDGKEKRR